MLGFANADRKGTAALFDGPVYTDSKSRRESRKWPFRQIQEKGASTQTDFLAMPVKQSGGHNPTPHEAGSSTPFWTNRIKLNTFVYTFVLLAFCLPVIALTLVLKIPSWYGARAAHWASAFTHCDFKGHFTPYDKPSISIWDKSGLFYINVAWGSMAFSTAKFIDVVWDIVVGRAGQAFLGWVTYKVSSQYLAMAMREAPVSYTTYVSLAFVPPNLTMTARLAGELLTNRGWRPRLIMVWIVLSSLFVLSFSTFVAAMSGYSSNSYAVLANHAGEVVPWDNFPVVQFAINDAWRMGEPGPVTITMGETCTQQGLKDDDSKGISQSYHRRDNQGEDGDGGKGDEQPWQYVPFNCTMFWRTVQYVSSYGLHGTQIQASTFTLNGLAHNLSSPTLNITTSYTPSSLSKLTGYLANYSMQSPKVLKDVNEISESTFWTYENETYSLAYVLDRASCQYSRSHNWGFSFLLLFITSLLLALWAGGTCALWLHVHRKDLTNMHVLRDRHLSSGPSGIFRSSWDLVSAIKRDVGPNAVSPEMSERDIRDLVRKGQGIGDAGQGQTKIQLSTEAGANTEKGLCSPISYHRSRWEAARSRLFPCQSFLLTGHENEKPTTGNPTESAFSLTSQTPMLASSHTPRSMSSSMLYQPSTASTARVDFSEQAPTDMIFGTDAVTLPANNDSNPTGSPSFQSHSSGLTFSPHSITRALPPVYIPSSDERQCEQTRWRLPLSTSTEALSHSETDSPSQATGKDSWPKESTTTPAHTRLDAITFQNDLGDD